MGPTKVADRSLAPDLARGGMLLLIALANVHIFIHGTPLGVRSYPIEQSGVDRVVTLLQMTLVDGRAFPLFAALFGYGMVQLIRRRTALDDADGASESDSVRLVRRRAAWMILFGLVHAALLFAGDIIGVYGVVGVLFAGLFAVRRERALLITAWALLVLVALFGAVTGLVRPGATSFGASFASPDPLGAVVLRLAEWAGLLVPVAFLVAPAVLFGAWAARRRILDDPADHRRLLSRVAVAGLGVGVLGGLPLALAAAGVVRLPLWLSLVGGAAHSLSGYAAAAGYLGLAGLVALRLEGRSGPVTAALAATGQRSMTCYVLQSVVFVPLLAGWAGGLGASLGVASLALIGVATWLITVAVAVLLQRAGRRGPLEVALRRLTYGSAQVKAAG